MAQFKVHAIILRSRSYGEADRLLTLMTREQGKLAAIAKGVRKPASKLRGGVQLFGYADLMLAAGKSLHTVTQAEAIEAFSPLRDDLDRFAYANYLTELTDAMIPEGEGNADHFLLLLTVLYLINTEANLSLTARLYELRLLYLLGLRPHFEACNACHGPVGKEGMVFSPSYGGVLCARCRGRDPKAPPVTANTLALMEHMMKMDLREVGKLQVGPRVAAYLEKALHAYILHHLDRPLKSWEFLKQMEGLEDGKGPGEPGNSNPGKN